MSPKYRITLTEQERKDLVALTRNGKTGAKKFINARALLLCDASPGSPAWTVASVAEALGVTSRTIEHLKKRVCRGRLRSGPGAQAQGKTSTRRHF